MENMADQQKGLVKICPKVKVYKGRLKNHFEMTQSVFVLLIKPVSCFGVDGECEGPILCSSVYPWSSRSSLGRGLYQRCEFTQYLRGYT